MMKTWNIPGRFVGSVFLLCSLFNSPSTCFAESADLILRIQDSQNQEAHKKILVEIFLSPDQKKNLEMIKNELRAVSITRTTVQFFRLGHPPQNIAIGRNIPADVARLAIQLATTYNGGVKYLLPEYRLSPDYIAIGTSAFDESSQIPILPEDLERLTDPKLSTAEFHALYRSLTGEDKRTPTYID
jgi:hypothetical protein